MTRTGVLADLRSVAGSRWFRRLFAVRLAGQFSDGLFQAALATFVLFSPERQASAAAIATAFAILYLPYSLIGPFTGVFLDRWSRRQVLVFGNLARSVIVVGVCILTAASHAGLDLGLLVLVALGVNRFVLAAVSAALPHTVPDDALVTANALTPTAGTLCAALGGLAGVVLRSALGGGDAGSVTVLGIAVLGFAGSGLLALLIPRRLLGPEGELPGDTIIGVVRGLADGARDLWRTRPAFRAISAVALHRIAFGAATVVVILLLRNTVNPDTDPDNALAGLSLVLGGAAGGALLAAVLTPALARYAGPVRWSAFALLLAAVGTPIGIAMATVPSMIAGAAALGFAGQSVKICADTTVQRDVADDFRGRVFSLYDVAVNIGLVAGVNAAAYASPASGIAPVVYAGIGVLLAATAGWYGLHWQDDPGTRSRPG